MWLKERVRAGSFAVKKVLGTDNPADLMTKHLAAQEVERHVETLGFERYQDRAEKAPMLAPIAEAKVRGGAIDEWSDSGIKVVRIHHKPRQSRFTPLRIEGAPPARSLTATRVTSGRFTDNGERFTIADNWTARSTAHALTSRPWTGTTTFWKRGEWKACSSQK